MTRCRINIVVSRTSRSNSEGNVPGRRAGESLPTALRVVRGASLRRGGCSCAGRGGGGGGRLHRFRGGLKNGAQSVRSHFLISTQGAYRSRGLRAASAAGAAVQRRAGDDVGRLGLRGVGVDVDVD